MTMKDVDIAILGAGLAGLSATYHLGHPKGTVVFEAKDHYGGHLYSWKKNGFTWDDGPHVSVTMNQYVKDLFAKCVKGEYEELAIKATNFYKGRWIDHPAQTSLWQIPEPLRTKCLESFLGTPTRSTHRRKTTRSGCINRWEKCSPITFAAAYTRKYWTCEPRDSTPIGSASA